ncbi:Fur family transcriptional regulator [Streptomyces aurantiogriseus]|uniref:Transcriptional repressor n=1 Tax=Streptomyces aurantiogriseus TaxID=66870 RepID=A0A918C794_9ACTN|nr:transcriptional repressor [Streptomyces aurantiogriseus]GGR09441.1 transcriptional repressor [Streptomyces aurantiogriseus]
MSDPTPKQRPTRQRSALVEALANCQDFISAQDLHARMTEDGTRIGLTTVYRALRDLEAADTVDVAQAGAGERLYRWRPAGRHRHYLICRACGSSRPVDSEVVEEWAGRIAADSGFAAVEHTVELTGVCIGCQPTTGEGKLPSCPWSPDWETPRHRAPGCGS